MTVIFVSLVTDLGNVINYSKEEFRDEVLSMIDFAVEREYNISDLNSNFILQDITNDLENQDFKVSDEVHEFINDLIKLRSK